MESFYEPCNTYTAAQAKGLLEATAAYLGREVIVTVCRAALREKDDNAPVSIESQGDESDAFYELTEEDYVRMLASKRPETFKTQKIRDAEEAARRARLTKAILRVQFPDNYILEAKFRPSDPILLLYDLLKKVISRADLPFYLYTTPPKQNLRDMEKDFYSLGLVPGGLVHFAYDFPTGFSEVEQSGILASAYLKGAVIALKDLHLLAAPAIQHETPENKATVFNQERVAEQRSSKQPVKKPKWMKL